MVWPRALQWNANRTAVWRRTIVHCTVPLGWVRFIDRPNYLDAVGRACITSQSISAPRLRYM
jgi:hypothetical protein